MDEYSILRKKQKKNAFAATALLISIAIALLVMVGAVLILSKVNDNDKVTLTDNNTTSEKANTEGNTKTESNDTTCEGLIKENVFNENLKNIKEAAVSYFTNERLPQTVGETEKITLGSMIDKKLIRTVYDASANTCSIDKSYVEVTKEDNEYVMKINLSCSDMEDYIIVHLGCYDYCDKDVCEKKEEKTYEYEYKKVISCVMSDWSQWGNWKTTREKTSNLKKEDIKTETSSKEVDETINATKKVTYNCNNYPGYTLVGDKCVKETTITSKIPATPSEYSYNCDKYPGYTLVGKKCIKETKKVIEIPATKNPATYSCPDGYTLDGTKCKRTVTKTETKPGSYVCPDGYTLFGTICKKITSTTDIKDAIRTCPSGYTLSGTKCTKTTTVTDTKSATAVYGTRTETKNITCNIPQCTTKTVFSCPSGKTCGNYPVTSCETVASTCQTQVQVKYIKGYTCPSGYTLNGKVCTMKNTSVDTKDSTLVCPSDYTLEGTKCKKTTSNVDIKDATFTCPSGYDKKLNTCIRTYTETEVKEATKDPDIYTCPSGYTLSGNKCYRNEIVLIEKDATRVDGGYTCPDGYTLNYRTCIKKTTKTDTQKASSNVTYTCPSGYTKNNNKCTKKGTEIIKTTYYRYATRTCNGGSTDIKWSESKNDKTLISEGYKLTGNKRELIIK